VNPHPGHLVWTIGGGPAELSTRDMQDEVAGTE
jgi:hypothetical protein